MYSVYYQIRCLIIANTKEEIGKKVNSITVSQSVLKNNNTNIYIVKTNNSRRSHYDIRRNAIRLDDRDYDSNNISSISNSISLAVNAVVINKENRFTYLLANYINKISIVSCVICIYLGDMVFLVFSMIFFIVCLIFKYVKLKKEIEILNNDIDIIKKEYKINDKDIEKLYNYSVIILYNGLSFNLLK
jgi:Zn-dependent membrane protease YugP